MKIAFVITDLGVGGAEIMLIKLLEQLGGGFDPVVISLRDEGELGERVKKLGIPLETIGLRPQLPNPLGLGKLAALLSRHKPDILQSWMYHADLIGGLVGKAVKVPRIVWGVRHSNLSASLNKRSTLMVVKLCALLSSRVPDRIVCNSETARRVHVERGYDEKKIVVIPNGFDLETFKPLGAARDLIRKEIGADPETPLVGLIARYDAQKNHAGFISAAALIHQEKPEVRFVLAGRGVDSSNEVLRREISAAGIEKVTHLLGARKNMPILMASLDVLVSSSKGEAFSNVIGEAMSCGIPCAATNAGDSSLIVGDCGRIVPLDDMRGLARATVELLSLSSGERVALGMRARARVSELFEISAVSKSFISLYHSLLEEKRGGPRPLK